MTTLERSLVARTTPGRLFTRDGRDQMRTLLEAARITLGRVAWRARQGDAEMLLQIGDGDPGQWSELLELAEAAARLEAKLEQAEAVLESRSATLPRRGRVARPSCVPAPPAGVGAAQPAASPRASQGPRGP